MSVLTAENLIAGSDSYNADVARIKRVVSTLKGMLEVELVKERKGGDEVRSCLAWLIGSPANRVDGNAYAIALTYYPCSESFMGDNPARIVAAVKFCDDSGRGRADHLANYTFDDFSWSPLSLRHPRRQYVATMAQNLDKLIEAAVQKFPEIRPHVEFFCERASQLCAEDT